MKPKGDLTHVMYHLLERMVISAEAGEQEQVNNINFIYEELIPAVYKISENGSQPQLQFEYESCRQSCYMAFRLPEHADKLIADARYRFDHLKHSWKEHS